MPLENATGRRQGSRSPAGFPIKTHAGHGFAAPESLDGNAIDTNARGMLLGIPSDPVDHGSTSTTCHVPPGTLSAPYVRRFQLTGHVARSQPLSFSPFGRSCRVAVEFNAAPGEEAKPGARLRCVGTAALVLAVTLGLVILLKAQALEYFWHRPVLSLYGLGVTAYVLSRFVLAFLYRPPADAAYFPTVSVVVACKNEEEFIGKTLERIYQSDYPPELMEVIAVD